MTVPASALSTGLSVIPDAGIPGENATPPGAARRPNGKVAVTSKRTYANVKREHPGRSRWVEDEARMRATYHGDRRHLSPFLVAHRFEGKLEGKDLRRARLGYGVGLNKAYMTEIFGHVRSAPAGYNYGPLAKDGVATPAKPNLANDNDVDELTTTAPEGGHALELWQDVTSNGVSMRNFFEGEVLEWITTSVGGVIVCDTNKPEGSVAISRADEKALGYRGFMRFVPFSAILDFGMGDAGFRWIKLAEQFDEREPDDEMGKPTPTRVVLYELLGDDTTQMARFTAEGKRIGDAVNLGAIYDRQGRPRLPITLARVRKHPDLTAFLGAGLLMGLDDIVIDLYNTFSEMREAFRDAAFSLFVHRGSNDTDVYEQFKDGSRLIRLGADEKAELLRVAVDSGEIDAGMKLIEMGVRNWVLSAKRQAEQSSGTAEKSSGIALVAEFQLDLKPLLVEVTETLDELQRDALFVVAQLLGADWKSAADIRVERETSFRLEDEASRITRIVGEFAMTLPIPPEAQVQLTMKWIEATGLIDMDAPADPDASVDGNSTTPVEDGTPASMQKPAITRSMTMRELLEAQIRELANAKQKAATDAAAAGGKGPFASAQGELTKTGSPRNETNSDLGEFPNVGGS